MTVTGTFIGAHIGEAGGSRALFISFVLPFALAILAPFSLPLPTCAHPHSSSWKILQLSSASNGEIEGCANSIA
jgi:hypothetical protein